MMRIEENRERILYGSIGRTLLWLGLPLMVVQLVNVSYNIVDTYWLSRYSEIAYAVPRQVMPTFMLWNSIAQGLMAANLALITQLLGARRYDEARKYVSFFVSATLLINSVVSIIYFILRPMIFSYIVRTPPLLYNDTLTYSGIITLDIVFSAFTLTYSTILQSIGDTRTPALINFGAASMNMVLDPIFILGVGINGSMLIPPMGVAGAAYATILSRFIGLLLLYDRLNKKYPYLKPRLTLKIESDWLAKNLRIGAPVTLMMASNSLAFMFQNALINQFGEYVAAAAAIGLIMMDLADATLWGFTSSIAVMVGQALGAGLIDRARKVAFKSMLYIGVSTLIGSSIVYMLREAFISVFTDNQVILSEADRFITVFLPSIVFFALFFIGMSVGRGSGHTMVPTIMGIIRLWGIRILLGYILAFTIGLGSLGVWISMSLSNVVAGLLMIIWVARGGWAIPVIKTREPETV
ncbi:MATE family efflux transporter [Desulfurococcus amylolyticus]|nr:MATE family efflux transporter [Desulfurococcus amylolyticus]